MLFGAFGGISSFTAARAGIRIDGAPAFEGFFRENKARGHSNQASGKNEERDKNIHGCSIEEYQVHFNNDDSNKTFH